MRHESVNERPVCNSGGADYLAGSRIVRYCGILAIVAVLCIHPEASAQGAGIKGMVQDEDGRPLEGVWLEARKAGTGVWDSVTYDGEPFARTRSRSDGAYSLHGLDAGVWLFTVVRAESQPDSEMVAFVRELARGRPIPSAPIARILRCYVAGETAVHEVNIVLGAGGSPMRCRLVGAKLTPEEFGYQATVLRSKPSHSAPGLHEEKFSSSDNEMEPFFYYAVPDADGRVDFGGATLGEYGTITVDAFTLDPEQPNVFGTVCSSALRDVRTADGTYEVPMRPHGIVRLTAKPTDVDARAIVQYTIWSGNGSEDNRYGDTQGGGVALILNSGVHVVRAMHGNIASRLTPMVVDQDTGSVSLSLAMEPCAPYSMRIVDQDGKPIERYAIRLNIAEEPGVVAPIGPSLYCLSGQVRIEGIHPGEYEAQFRYDVRPPFDQSLRLGADEVAEVVVPPGY